LSTSAARTLGRCETCDSTADAALVAALRQWRTDRAGRDKVPAYVVLTDVTLVALAERLPRTPDDLLEIPGIAERKVAAYGDEILTVIGGAPSSDSDG
jgi:DNA helicase-2/ATP-dependent DNA helicase PcrA